ncbi:MAG TPA: trehalose-6-phosphate synthase [Pseudomonadales bacterium]
MRLVVVSNRVPVPPAEGPGGLAVALKDALGHGGGVWLGWNGLERTGRAATPHEVERNGVTFATVPLMPEDVGNFYAGYANSVLWPGFHGLLHAVQYRPEFWNGYQSVNGYFADLAARVVRPGDVIWVHDYHFVPLAAELRRRGVTERIGFFLHIPFPPLDVLRALPGHRRLLEAMLAYDLVGFQTAADAENFAGALAGALGARIDAAAGVAELTGRRARFGAFPIGIDVDATARTALAQRGSRIGQRITRTLRGRKLVIGADRLDYTKGLPQRFDAYERLLAERHGELDDRVVYAQIAAPSRETVPAYRELASALEAQAGRINARFGNLCWTPLKLVAQPVPRDALLGYLSLADVALVTSLRDGMNLVAKEFLAAQTAEDPGVLVLSNLTGAAEELADAALVVNPYDSDATAQAIHRALTMPFAERRQRWALGLATLRDNTARIWRARFLDALTGSRRPQRVVPAEPGLAVLDVARG